MISTKPLLPIEIEIRRLHLEFSNAAHFWGAHVADDGPGEPVYREVVRTEAALLDAIDRLAFLVPAADLQAEPGPLTVAHCITQLDTWSGRLEAAIDRQAHAALGQHPNDEPPAERDPMEQLP